MERGRVSGPLGDARPYRRAGLAPWTPNRAALDAELQAYGLVQQEKVNWFDSYKLNHRTLAQINYKEPKKADTYFKTVTKAKKAAAPPRRSEGEFIAEDAEDAEAKRQPKESSPRRTRRTRRKDEEGSLQGGREGGAERPCPPSRG